MDDYFIEIIDWSSCAKPINAIDFIVSLTELEKLESTLEMLGLTLYESIEVTLSDTTQDDYLTLDVKGTRVEIIAIEGVKLIVREIKEN